MDRKQQLRLRRQLVALAIYGPCAVLLFLVAHLGYLPTWLPPVWTGLFAAANGVFYLLIRSGWNLRFRDPSFTMAQMAVAIVAVAIVLYHAEAARGTMLMFLLVIIFFGVLQLRTAEVLIMGAFAAAAYGVVIALLAVHRPDRVDLRLEGIQWLTLTATLAVLCPFIGYLSDVRRRLSDALRTIRDVADRDALTGVFNRRHLAETLGREIARCERGAAAFLLVIVDIDHFKQVNDTHGHLVGDQVLSLVAECLSASLRKGDYVARYGGEEFVLLASAANRQEAFSICERLRSRIESAENPTLPLPGVTASFGASFWRPGDDQAALVARADQALYHAKRRGRNRIEIDPELAPVTDAAAMI